MEGTKKKGKRSQETDKENCIKNYETGDFQSTDTRREKDDAPSTLTVSSLI
jgi:hypothetical protein